MLTCMYVCGLTTFAAVYTNLTIYPSTLSVSAGEDVIFSAKTDETDTDVSYQWSIDGVTIDVETPGLHLAWDEYITYFPTDAEDDAQRTVTVATIDDREMIATDSAQLLVNHGVCGD